MKLITLKCPDCNARLEVNPDLEKIICNYCGAEIYIDDEATKLDRIENVKLKHRIKNHEQDIKEIYDKKNIQKEYAKEDRKRKRVGWNIFGLVIALMFIFLGGYSKMVHILAFMNITINILSILTNIDTFHIFKNDSDVFHLGAIITFLIMFFSING